jgi:hypothetical protein
MDQLRAQVSTASADGRAYAIHQTEIRVSPARHHFSELVNTNMRARFCLTSVQHEANNLRCWLQHQARSPPWEWLDRPRPARERDSSGHCAATSPVVLQATRGRVVSAEHGFCRHLEREAEPLLSREFPMALKDPTNAGHVSQLPVGGGIACPWTTDGLCSVSRSETDRRKPKCSSNRKKHRNLRKQTVSGRSWTWWSISSELTNKQGTPPECTPFCKKQSSLLFWTEPKAFAICALQRHVAQDQRTLRSNPYQMRCTCTREQQCCVWTKRTDPARYVSCKTDFTPLPASITGFG